MKSQEHLSIQHVVTTPLLKTKKFPDSLQGLLLGSGDRPHRVQGTHLVWRTSEREERERQVPALYTVLPLHPHPHPTHVVVLRGYSQLYAQGSPLAGLEDAGTEARLAPNPLISLAMGDLLIPFWSILTFMPEHWEQEAEDRDKFNLLQPRSLVRREMTAAATRPESADVTRLVLTAAAEDGGEASAPFYNVAAGSKRVSSNLLILISTAPGKELVRLKRGV